MIKTLEKTGRTEDDAINAALAELGLDRDDVSVEILERAKSGFLGIGASPAVVRVSYEAEDEPAPVEETVVVEAVEGSVSTSQTTLSIAAARSICTSASTLRIIAASARNPSPSLPRRWRRRSSSISAAWRLNR